MEHFHIIQDLNYYIILYLNNIVNKNKNNFNQIYFIKLMLIKNK